ncbi:MAG: glutamine synthetase III [Firmicutes bacterium]|nr:glutamine synthetase III [Bacillota bacterium]
MNVPEIFGSLVFNDKTMQKALKPETYKAFKAVAENGGTLSKACADEIACAMKTWAVERGATHYTHWFQPMTGITAEKHDSFIAPDENAAGGAIMQFSGKQLIQGEPDASSFPSGGLRSTFEARGYTAWDTSGCAFIKDGTLCIPTAFISYGGQVLDKKTPLLRSMSALKSRVLRFLTLIGKSAKSIGITAGVEQEYFLIDKKLFDKRKDLISCGRTLLGARPVKGQELEDHYFGTIRPRVLAYMQELDAELWKLGILAKTRHNEAAPAQHELAPIHTEVSTAADHNQLTMEFMKKVADRHGLACLLHEKPFAGVNGSGKHNNWSLTADGENLLEPGKNPENNLPFLLLLAAVLRAADEHQDLLRLCTATAGNDHRLGSGEAPPAILSVYLGSELTDILENMCAGKCYQRKKAERIVLGNATPVPEFLQDTADRNRTSPLAFTGNKFEFRMLGASVNVAEPNVMLNAAVADALEYICARLEKEGADETSVKKLIAELYTRHKRIVFNGNNYSADWIEEANRRGLLNLAATPDALPYGTNEKNAALMERLGVYSLRELESRREILTENYCKVISIEALTLLSMTVKEVLPASFYYQNELCTVIEQKAELDVSAEAEKALLKKIAALSDKAYKRKIALEKALEKAKCEKSLHAASKAFYGVAFTYMHNLRECCDALETLVSKKHWPFPTYSELLFSV